MNLDSPETIVVFALVLGFIAAATETALNVHAAKWRNHPAVILRRCKIQLSATYSAVLRRPATPADRIVLLSTLQRAAHTAGDS